MDFISELRKLLVTEKQVYDLSRNEEFAEFNFIGFKETPLTIEFVAFIKADGLTESQIVNLRDSFFRITQIVSYDFGLKPYGRNPNGLLCFVFEDKCPDFLINFITKQTKVSHFGKSVVTVSWAINIIDKKITTHNGLVSLFPPIFINENWVFPGKEYLNLFIRSYNFQPIQIKKSKNSSKVVVNKALNKESFQIFNKLEKRIEEINKVIEKLDEIYRITKIMSDQQSKYNFSNIQKVQIFESVTTYIENSNAANQDVNKSLEDLKQLIESLQRQYPQATEEQATAIINIEFREIQRTQPQLWQNFLNLKRLWNGVKKGSLKAGEHFVEETAWGKAIIGFLEGVTDEAE